MIQEWLSDKPFTISVMTVTEVIASHWMTIYGLITDPDVLVQRIKSDPFIIHSMSSYLQLNTFGTHISACFNTLKPKQSGRHIADDLFKCILLRKTEIWIKTQKCLSTNRILLKMSSAKHDLRVGIKVVNGTSYIYNIYMCIYTYIYGVIIA